MKPPAEHNVEVGLRWRVDGLVGGANLVAVEIMRDTYFGIENQSVVE